jgi:hypothetical protein
VGPFRISAPAPAVGALVTVLCADYSLWLHNRPNTGTLFWAHGRGRVFTDLTLLEMVVLFLLANMGLPPSRLRVLATPCAATL